MLNLSLSIAQADLPNKIKKGLNENVQAAITAVQGAVPEKVLSNSDLEKMKIPR